MSGRCSYRKRKRPTRKGVAGLALGAIGLGVNVVSQIMANRRQREMLEEQQKEQEELARLANYRSDLNTLQQYNNYYNTEGLQATAAQGIRLPNTPATMANGGLEPVSSGVSFLKGASHEEGGISVDTNMDGFEDVELEGDEAISQEMVFSKRRKLPKEALEYLEGEGMKGFSGMTYADAIGKIGKMQAMYEEKLDKYDPIEVNTANLMLERLENLIEGLFSIQEETKNN